MKLEKRIKKQIPLLCIGNGKRLNMLHEETETLLRLYIETREDLRKHDWFMDVPFKFYKSVYDLEIHEVFTNMDKMKKYKLGVGFFVGNERLRKIKNNYNRNN